MAELAIRTENLTKRYGSHRGIEEVNIDVASGDMFGFIGPNGAGKTTTIRTIMGLIFPTGGRAEVFGRDVVCHGHQIRSWVGYVPPEVKYYPRMSVRELLSYSASFHGVTDMTRARHLAERLGLDAGRRIEELSSGNAKKVALVQSMLHSPRLLVLDEPTNGLDPLVQNTFVQLLREQNAAGVTVFLSSHILEEVQRLCRRVAIIKEGRIIANEDVATLRQKRLRKVSFTSERALTSGDFPSGNAREMVREGDTVRLLYAGDSNTLVRELARFDLHQLRIEEPTLEEVFLHYYQATPGGRR